MGLFGETRMTLIVSLPGNSPELARAAFEAGADAVKVHINVEHRASGIRFGSLKEERSRLESILDIASGRPVGIVLGGTPDIGEKESAECLAMGFSFISLYAHHFPVWLMRLKGWKKMVAPDYTYDMDRIRSLGECGIDVLEASVVKPEEYGKPLNLSDLALYRSIRRQVNMPIVVPSQKKIKPEDVSFLAEAGMDAVMIGAVVTGREAGSLAEVTGRFRKAVEAL